MVIRDNFCYKKELEIDDQIIYCRYTMYNVGCDLYTEVTKIIKGTDGELIGTEVELQCVIFYHDDKQFLKSIRKMDSLIDIHRLKLIKERRAQQWV